MQCTQHGCSFRQGTVNYGRLTARWDPPNKAHKLQFSACVHYFERLFSAGHLTHHPVGQQQNDEEGEEGSDGLGSWGGAGDGIGLGWVVLVCELGH